MVEHNLMGCFTILRLADVIGPYDTTYRCIKTYWSLCCAPPHSVYRLKTWPAVLHKLLPLDPKRNPLIQKWRSGRVCSDAGTEAVVTARLSFTYSGDVTEFVRVLLRHIELSANHESKNQASPANNMSVYNLCCAEAVTLQEFLQMFRRHICPDDEKDVERTGTEESTPQVPSSIATAAGTESRKSELMFDFNSAISSSDSSSSSSDGSGSDGTSSNINIASGGSDALHSSNKRSDRGRRKCSNVKKPLPTMYPSVQRLIPLRVEKVTKQFEWTPTPLVCSLGVNPSFSITAMMCRTRRSR
eukprot:GHVS01092115.1.p1 GENE.GHVS01092115.1~~GHVS01092115.1.p1  ORF type:complete len:301 (-),score=37.04 GHVS01092115.1:933-1835(-)